MMGSCMRCCELQVIWGHQALQGWGGEPAVLAPGWQLGQIRKWHQLLCYQVLEGWGRLGCCFTPWCSLSAEQSPLRAETGAGDKTYHGRKCPPLHNNKNNDLHSKTLA